MAKYVELTGGLRALVDDEDFERVDQHSWHSTKHRYGSAYARTNFGRKNTSMHRFILQAPKGTIVDHINRDTLDNRKANLRFVDRSENSWNTKLCARNTSGVKGVTFNASHGRWVARISVRGVRLHIGSFIALEDAKEAITQARKEHHGDFSCDEVTPVLQHNQTITTRRKAKRDYGGASGVRGVSWAKKSRKWEAYGFHKGKKIGLGFWLEKEQAVLAVNEWRRRMDLG